MHLTGISWVADQARRAGWRWIFGEELSLAKFTHWSAQWYPRWQSEQLQWDAVRELVAHASEASSFHRQRLAGFEPFSELTPERFREIPPLTRADVVMSAAEILVPLKRRPALRRRSGGSSGRQVAVPMTASTYCWYIAGTWRGLRWWGVDFTDRGAILLGSGSAGLQGLAVRAKDWVMNWLRLSVDDVFSHRAAALLARLERFGPTFIYGYPSAVHRLSQIAREYGWRPSEHLRVIVLTGEPVYAFQRQAIEETFECPAVEEYGNGEVGSMAFECRKHRLHVTSENVYLETAPIEPRIRDEAGRILVTQLRNKVFPLIRYEIGDAGVLETSPCACGRALPTVRVTGRLRERLILNGDMMLARPLVERLLGALPERLQGHVQVAHPTPGHLVLKVAGGPDHATSLGEVGRVAASVLDRTWHASVVEVERLRRLPSGKLPYFVRAEPHR
jgi:phenylacetate-CoA ligase